jgi:hypothetical protein
MLSQELTTLLLKLKINNVLTKLLRNATPSPSCTGIKVMVADETSALNITQLTGIWLVLFGLGFLLLMVTCVNPCFRKQHLRRYGRSVHPVYAFDQNGQQINCLGKFQTDLHIQLKKTLIELS